MVVELGARAILSPRPVRDEAGEGKSLEATCGVARGRVQPARQRANQSPPPEAKASTRDPACNWGEKRVISTYVHTSPAFNLI